MKRKREQNSPVCGSCMGLIDREKALRAYRTGREYVHECGRVLVKAGQYVCGCSCAGCVSGSDYWHCYGARGKCSA